MNDRDLIGIGGKYTPAEAKGEKYIFLFRVLAPSNWGEEEILEVESEAGMAGVNRAQLENSGGGVQINSWPLPTIIIAVCTLLSTFYTDLFSLLITLTKLVPLQLPLLELHRLPF